MTRHPFDDVLVVIPGIMGSTLLRDGMPVWDLSARVVAANLAALGWPLRRLALPAGIGDDHPGDGVVPGGLMPDLHILPGLWPVTVGYDKLLKRLTSRFALTPVDPARPDRPANLVPFAYDWRLSTRYNGRRLARVVEPVLERRRAQPGRADARLVFVCHSMGGLVARWYLDREGGAAHTRKLVTLATPHRGALRALTTLVNGIRFGVGPLAVDLTALAASLPSLHQLLPEYACIDIAPGAGLAKTTETAVPAVDPAMLADAMRFHDELDRAPAFLPAADGGRGPTLDLHPVVGIHQPTATTVRFRDGTAIPEPTIGGRDERGDATVPRLAARPRTLPGDSPTLVHVGDSHGALHANAAVLDHLEGILTGTRVEHRAAAVTIGVTADDITPAGQPLDVHAYPGDPAVLLEARLLDPHDPAGWPVASRPLTRDGDHHHTALTGIPPGGYVLQVGRRLPTGHLVDTVTTPLAVVDATSADPD